MRSRLTGRGSSGRRWKPSRKQGRYRCASRRRCTCARTTPRPTRARCWWPQGGEPLFLDREQRRLARVLHQDRRPVFLRRGNRTDDRSERRRSIPPKRRKCRECSARAKTVNMCISPPTGCSRATKMPTRKRRGTGRPQSLPEPRGTTTFIATLSPEDGLVAQPVSTCCGQGEGCQGDWQTDASASHRRGHARWSQPRVHVQPAPDRLRQRGRERPTRTWDEVFLFEAPSGVLRCVSCNPSGEPPVPTEFNTTSGWHRPDRGVHPDGRRDRRTAAGDL